MATELLYFTDPAAMDFAATVLALRPAAGPGEPAGTVGVVLDRTAFYPGGGGQPCDTGTIADHCVVAVSHAEDDAALVLHWVPAAADPGAPPLPSPGQTVACGVNQAHRRDLMQQHTGQHILSALALRDYGAQTTGFHLGEDTATVDLALPSDLAADAAAVERLVADLETKACEVVFADGPVRIHLVSPGETPAEAAAAGLELRVREHGPAPKGGDQWRVIEIAGLDLNPCGGTHVSTTGQIGLITVQHWEKMRDGVRLEFACGMRALAAHRWRRDALRQLAGMQSVHEREAVERAAGKLAASEAKDKEIRFLRGRLLGYRATEIAGQAERLPGGNLSVLRDDELGVDELKALANSVCASSGHVALFASAVGGIPRLVFARSEDLGAVNAGRLLSEVAGKLGGRGGGSPKFGQGGGGDPAGLTGALDWAAAEARRMLGA